MFLGLDLGTSGLRAVLVDAKGNAHGEASANYTASNPYKGWSEQEPADWLKALSHVLFELRTHAPDAYSKIKALAISGHMHGAITLDEDDCVVRPCILWNDTRSHAFAQMLDEDDIFRATSGNIVFPGFTAPKLAWMAKHEPEYFARIRTIMLPKDYLVFHLTGVHATEMSDAAGTSWLDVGKRAWSPELIEASGVDQSHMPELHEGTAIVGRILPEIADKYHLPSQMDVVAGGADNACAACGIGAVDEGQGFISLGTSGVILVARDTYAPMPETAVHTFCHAIPDKWYQMGVTLAATDCLNWLAEHVGTTAEALTDALPDEPIGPSPVLFLPYLSGERTPHNNADIRGAFLGLSRNTDTRVLTQSVMEGVAFALKDCLMALIATGTSPKSLIAVGGGSNSSFWLKTLSDVLNIQIDVPQHGDFGSAIGAARLAMIGVGEASVADVLRRPEISHTHVPNPARTKLYEKNYQKFKTAYSAVKDI